MPGSEREEGVTYGAPVDDALLRTILAGCWKASPGPWEALPGDEKWTACVRAETEDGYDVLVPAGHKDDGFGCPDEDAQHIARLDPQTVARIVYELIKRRKADGANEVVLLSKECHAKREREARS
jgi:hypothetical protein